jgi:Carbohydrate family 9 binding domain-like
MNPILPNRLGRWLVWSLVVHASLATAWWVVAGCHSSTTVASAMAPNEVKQPVSKSDHTKIPTTTDGGRTLARVVTKPLVQAIKDLPPGQQKRILGKVARALDALAQDKPQADLAAVTPRTVQAWQKGALVAHLVQVVHAQANAQVVEALERNLADASAVEATNAVDVQSGEAGDLATIAPRGDSMAAGNETAASGGGEVGTSEASPPMPSGVEQRDGKTNSPGEERARGGREATQGANNSLPETAKIDAVKVSPPSSAGPLSNSQSNMPTGKTGEPTQATKLAGASRGGVADAVSARLPQNDDQASIWAHNDPRTLGKVTSVPLARLEGHLEAAPATPSSAQNQGVRPDLPGGGHSGGGRDAVQSSPERITDGAQIRSGNGATPVAQSSNATQFPNQGGPSELTVGTAKRAGGIPVKSQGGVQTSQAYQKLASQVAQRGLQAGSAWIHPSLAAPGAEPVVESESIPKHVLGGAEVIAVPLGPIPPFKPEFPSLAFQTIPCLSAGFTLDGGSDKWAKVPRLVMRPEWGTDASDQVVQVGWRNDGIYVRCEISDPDHQIRHAPATQFWEGDNVEVWFDGQNLKKPYRSRTTGQHFWVWPEGAENNSNQIGGEARIEQRGGGVEVFPFTKDRLQRAAMRTTSGWTVEFRLDKNILINATLEPGRIIGFNVYLNTLSGTNWYWSAGKKANTWYQPDTWGDLLLAGSDAVLERADVGADGVYPPLVAGQVVRLRVTDPDMDLDPNRPDRVEVTLQAQHGAIHRVALVESGNSTGVFLGGIATTPALEEDPPGLLGVYPGERIKVSYIDQVRSNGAKGAEVVMILRVGGAVLVGDIDKP